jgi:hypothetical protein
MYCSPELVKSNVAEPLSSDAFTAFGAHDGATHNNEVRRATRRLFEQVIPQLAQSIDESASDPDGIFLVGTALRDRVHGTLFRLCPIFSKNQ